MNETTEKQLNAFSCLRNLSIDVSDELKRPKRKKKHKFKRKNELLVPKKITREWYKSYLKTKHWRGFSKRQLYNYPFCYCCGAKSTEVHHKIYKPFKEKDHFVVSICRNCHENIHTLILNDKKVYLSNAHKIYKSLLSLEL